MSAGLSARGAIKISLLGGVLTFLLAACLLVLLLGEAAIGEQAHVDAFRGWGGLLLDPLSALMAVLIAGISLVVRLYSVRYMAEELGYTRFFMMLDVMTGAVADYGGGG